jgi:hypothetical protein
MLRARLQADHEVYGRRAARVGSVGSRAVRTEKLSSASSKGAKGKPTASDIASKLTASHLFDALQVRFLSNLHRSTATPYDADLRERCGFRMRQLPSGIGAPDVAEPSPELGFLLRWADVTMLVAVPFVFRVRVEDVQRG